MPSHEYLRPEWQASRLIHCKVAIEEAVLHAGGTAADLRVLHGAGLLGRFDAFVCADEARVPINTQLFQKARAMLLENVAAFLLARLSSQADNTGGSAAPVEEKLGVDNPFSSAAPAPPAILFYRADQPYGEFSNFFVAPFLVENSSIIWASVEHYFQCQKFCDRPDIFYELWGLAEPSEVHRRAQLAQAQS